MSTTCSSTPSGRGSMSRVEKGQSTSSTRETTMHEWDRSQRVVGRGHRSSSLVSTAWPWQYAQTIPNRRRSGSIVHCPEGELHAPAPAQLENARIRGCGGWNHLYGGCPGGGLPAFRRH